MLNLDIINSSFTVIANKEFSNLSSMIPDVFDLFLEICLLLALCIVSEQTISNTPFQTDFGIIYYTKEIRYIMVSR